MVVAAGGLASSAVIDVDGRKTLLLLPQCLQSEFRTGLCRDRFIMFAFATFPNHLYIHDHNCDTSEFLFDVPLPSPSQLITQVPCVNIHSGLAIPC
jgi:hypothetical protein